MDIASSISFGVYIFHLTVKDHGVLGSTYNSILRPGWASFNISVKGSSSSMTFHFFSDFFHLRYHRSLLSSSKYKNRFLSEVDYQWKWMLKWKWHISIATFHMYVFATYFSYFMELKFCTYSLQLFLMLNCTVLEFARTCTSTIKIVCTTTLFLLYSTFIMFRWLFGSHIWW